MTEILARCGCRCDLCPAYKGNIHSADDRQAVSEGWLKYIGAEVPPEEIGCAGCLRSQNAPDPECPIRPCVIKRGLANCAHCKDFGCDKLKSRMDFMENRYGGDFSAIPKEDFDRFILPYLSKDRLLKIRDALKATGRGGGEPS